MRLRRPGAWILGPLVVLSACGPTDREVGVAVLAAMPAIAVVGFLLQLLYRAAWQAAEGARLPGLSPRPTAALIAVTGIAVLIWARELGDDTMMAFVLAGTSYATVLLLAMRAAVRSVHYSWAVLAPWVIFTPPAVYLAAAGATTGEADGWLGYFIVPGYAGLVSGPLALLLSIEVVARYIRRRRREREAEPVFPEARIHSD